MRFTRIARTASSTLYAFLSDNVVHESYANCVDYCRGSHLTPRESRASCQGSRCQIQPSASRRHRPRRRSALTRRLSAAISHACAARRSRTLLSLGASHCSSRASRSHTKNSKLLRSNVAVSRSSAYKPAAVSDPHRSDHAAGGLFSSNRRARYHNMIERHTQFSVSASAWW